jgi:hypothetical protein
VKTLHFFGLTGAGTLAKAKEEAHALLGELRQVMSIDVVEGVQLEPLLRDLL